MYKTIRITDEQRERLSKHGEYGEKMSDIIERLLNDYESMIKEKKDKKK